MRFNRTRKVARKPPLNFFDTLEEREDETFAEPYPGESGSDNLFPYHHFILRHGSNERDSSSSTARFSAVMLSEAKHLCAGRDRSFASLRMTLCDCSNCQIRFVQIEPCLSNHHRQLGDSVVIRFCVRCGLSHYLVWMYPYNLGMQEVPYPLNINMRVPIWQHIKENERDMTVSDLCPVEQESDSLKRRYLLVPKN